MKNMKEWQNAPKQKREKVKTILQDTYETLMKRTKTYIYHMLLKQISKTKNYIEKEKILKF